jgi:hypothetical protein
MTRARTNPLPNAETLFEQRLADDHQCLLRPDGMPRNVAVFARYWPTNQAQPERCPVCLRIYDATPASPGGQPHGYCSPACRSWAADTRRRSQPRRWVACQECGADFFALDGRPACPPPGPESWWGQSECRSTRKLRLAAAACRRYRTRLTGAVQSLRETGRTTATRFAGGASA